MQMPRIIISGLSGGAGKTMVSLGLARALTRSGQQVKTFKKGPDYIDAAWLALAAGTPASNLDLFFTPGDALQNIFCKQSTGFTFSLIEGNRGIFDGLDLQGSCSTAELSRILTTPLVLVVDCTKMTRTVAAVVAGCVHFEPNVHIGGVILNRTGTARHQQLVRSAVEDLAGVPVLGVLPRRAMPFITERHMGLAGTAENSKAQLHLNVLADFMQEHCNLDAIAELAASAQPLAFPLQEPLAHMSPESIGKTHDFETATQRENCVQPKARQGCNKKSPTIGYVKDAALWFYYEENLAALCDAGARLVPLSLLDTEAWPHIDGLYLGGGLPELYAKELSANTERRKDVLSRVNDGLPVYAECGGMMYLAQELRSREGIYPMAGALPFAVEMCRKPQGLGYIEADVVYENPFHPVGTHFRGHEFHFSRCVPRAVGTGAQVANLPSILKLSRGKGMLSVERANFDGVVYKKCFAAYTHIYAPAVPHWAPNFVRACFS